MSTVEESTAAIKQLPADQLARLSTWLLGYSEKLWDQEIEQDAREGLFDDLIEQALEEHRSGRMRPL